MAERKLIVLDADGQPEQHDIAADTFTMFGLTMAGNIAMGANKITGLLAGTAATDAVNIAQLDSAVINGGTVKELLLHESQLSNPDGFYSAMASFFAAQPVATDTIILTDGTTTRTYTFVANIGAESVATDVSIETDAATAMARFALRVTADIANSPANVFFTTELDDINAVGVLAVIEKVTAVGDSLLRMYGTWGTQASFQVVEYSDGTTVDNDYQSSAATTASTTDPAGGRSGVNNTQGELLDGEIHMIRNNDSQYSWDDADNLWQVMSGAASVPDATSGSGGAIKGKVTFDSDKGTLVVAGVMEVTLAASAGLKFSGGAIAVEPSDFAGTGLEDDGSDNLRLSTQGNGISGGGGTTLSVDPDSETGGNIEPVTVGANGVGVDINSIAGAGLAADGSANLDVVYSPSNQSPYTTDGTGVTKGDLVYASANDVVTEVDADTATAKDAFGLAVTTVGASAAVQIITEGVLSGVTVAGSPAFGALVYAASGGGLTTTKPAGNVYLVQAGFMKNATDLQVKVEYLGRQRA